MSDNTTRFPLVFGLGVDRATGVMSVEMASFMDLRNAYSREGKIKVRGGLVVPAGGEPLPGCTDIVGVFQFRTIQGGVKIGYNRTTRVLSVWRCSGLGENPLPVGDWATLTAGAPLPRITGAESFGKFFLAHDESLYNFRARTIYFDPELTPGTQLVPLQGDFDGAGDADIYFRIVYAHLNYLWATAFGTAADPNRPEILRVSIPGEPTSWNANHYFIAGIRNDHITALGVSGAVLEVCKRSETYAVSGTDQTNFAINPLDRSFGAINHQLCITLGSSFYRWSEQGPRVSQGQPSIDLAVPLELDGPEPATLTPAGIVDYGFQVYDPAERAILWCFPQLDPVGEKTLVYTGSVRVPGIVRFGYHEISQPIYSGGVITEGAATAGAQSTAYATDVEGVDDGVSGTARKVDIEWTNNSLGGGEAYEIYRKPSGGSWEMAQTGAASGPTQSVEVTGFLALTDYEIAIRFIKGGTATEGYESIDPDSWTAITAPGAKDTFTTDCEAPVLGVPVWSRDSSTTTIVDFAWTLAELGVGFSLERSDDGIVGWAEVASIPAAGNPRVYEYSVPGVDLYTGKFFRIIAEKGANVSAESNEREVFFGVTDVPEILLVAQDSDTAEMQFFIQIPPVSIDKIEVQTSPDGVGSWVTQYLGDPAPYPFEVPSPIALASQTFYRARFIESAFGVDDPGDFTAVDDITLTNVVPPAAAIFDSTACLNYDNGEGARSASLEVALDSADDYYVFYEFNDAGVKQRKVELIAADDFIALADVFITGRMWPFASGTDPFPPYEIELAARIRSGIKIGPEDTTMQLARITGGPHTVTVVQPNPLVGQIDIDWTNNNPPHAAAGTAFGNIFIYWNPDPQDFIPSRLLGIVLDTVNSLHGVPTGGNPALPASGEDIKVLVIWGGRISGALGDPSVTKYSDIDTEGGEPHEMGT